jgi:hypothetical protein
MTTTRLSIKDLQAAAARLGATVENHCGPRTACYMVDAPAGKVWVCSGDIHCLVLEWRGTSARPTWPEEKQDAIADAIDRISRGLTDCDDPDCDYCHPEEPERSA